MANREKETLENAFSVIVAEILKAKLNVAMPGIVTAFDGSNKISVQPVVNRKYVNQDGKPLPTIEGVPIHFFGAGDYWLTCDIPVGSWVLLVCSQRSIDAWKNSSDGEPGDAATARRFSFSDSVAIPGLLPFTQAFTVGPGIQLRNKAGTVKVAIDGDVITIDNGSGTITLDATGKVDINGHLTVDP